MRSMSTRLDDYDRGLIEMAEEKNKTLGKARIEMNYLTGEEEVKRLAELREKWEMDYNSGIGHARRQGIKEGEEKGIRKGTREKQLEVAKKMKEEKLPIELIIKITELTKEEIEKL